MTAALIFLACIMGVIIWWLARQTINQRPWVEVPAEAGQSLSPDSAAYVGEPGSLPVSPVKLGLGAFLCVATSLFGLLMSAYFSRMEVADWIQLTPPRILWFNTFVLLVSCIVVHRTLAAQRAGKVQQVKSGLLSGSLLTLAFLVGQLIAWQQLSLAGETPAANASNAFFYLFTAAHALHLLGGLWVWSRAMMGANRNMDTHKLGQRIELCAVYWDYLFVIWLILFFLLLTS